MPYVTLPEDQIHLYYRTNLPNDDLTRIPASGKETILYLHPTFLSSCAFINQQLKFLFTKRSQCPLIFAIQ